MKPGALLLLLAVYIVVASGQTNFTLTKVLNESATLNISFCPFRFYGRLYSFIDVSFGTNSTVSYCFKNDPSETAQDCFFYPSDEQSINVSVTNMPLNAQGFSRLKNTTDCVYTFNTKMMLRLLLLEPIAFIITIAPIPPFNVTMMVNNVTVDIWLVQVLGMKEVSACRTSDNFILPNSTGLDPETCSTLSCNESAFVTSVSSCGPMDVCLGNNKCVKRFPICTVTGSTVIDFFGKVHSVSDRCGYSLVKTQGSSAFEIVARFMERRRKDVPLLDYLVIKQQSGDLILQQGGRVQTNKRTIKLTNTTQLIDGVEFFKNDTGAFVRMPSNVSNVTIFFDGFTAHVSNGGVQGLCGSLLTPKQNTTLDEQRSSSLDHPSCMTTHSDAVDSTINCTSSTEHCNLMRQAPFTACHSHVSPDPYITACTNTLCSYPAVDAVKCHVLEAYDTACQVNAIAVGEWRSTAGCSDVPQDFCQDHDCSSHEFCGEMFSTTSCLCRALFASRYKPNNTFGEPTVCRENSASVSLAACLLLDKGINHSVLHLKDANCTGHMDEDHMLTFSFNSSHICGGEVVTNGSQVIYKNTIMGKNDSNSVITRHNQVQIDFTCSYVMANVTGVSFKIKDSSVKQQIVSGVWNYTLMMNAYIDAGHLNLVKPSTEVQLNQQIWMELKTEGLDGDMVSIVIDSCWATNQPPSNSSVRYDVIINKCSNPADDTVRVKGNGLGTSSYFSFSMFEFSGGSKEIYLHCQVELCPKQGPSCVPTCSGSRKRRAFSSRHAGRNQSALITMTWTK